MAEQQQAHLAAVKRDGFALKYVSQQTPEICVAAIEQDLCALDFVVIEHTPEIYKVAKQQYDLLTESLRNNNTNKK